MTVRSRWPKDEIGTFSFAGGDVEACLIDGLWHVRSGGHEVSGRHLGEATRALFNPRLHEQTLSLITAILAWRASMEVGATVESGQRADETTES